MIDDPLNTLLLMQEVKIRRKTYNVICWFLYQFCDFHVYFSMFKIIFRLCACFNFLFRNKTRKVFRIGIFLVEVIWWKNEKFNRLSILSVIRTDADTDGRAIRMRNSGKPIKSNAIQFINIDAFTKLQAMWIILWSTFRKVVSWPNVCSIVSSGLR